MSCPSRCGISTSATTERDLFMKVDCRGRGTPDHVLSAVMLRRHARHQTGSSKAANPARPARGHRGPDSGSEYLFSAFSLSSRTCQYLLFTAQEAKLRPQNWANVFCPRACSRGVRLAAEKDTRSLRSVAWLAMAPLRGLNCGLRPGFSNVCGGAGLWINGAGCGPSRPGELALECPRRTSRPAGENCEDGSIDLPWNTAAWRNQALAAQPAGGRMTSHSHIAMRC